MNPQTIARAAYLIIALNLVMVAVALVRYRPFFLQPSAGVEVLWPVMIFAVYAVVAFWLGRRQGAKWKVISRTATIFGIAGGLAEVVNILLENEIPVAVTIPAVSLMFMVGVFASWGVAGYWTTRSLSSVRAGVLTGVLAAAVCMLIGVIAGFVIQLFIAHPDRAFVSTWAEFKRSGWTDPYAFWLANTLESASTHLVMAPVIGCVVGGVGASIARQFNRR